MTLCGCSGAQGACACPVEGGTEITVVGDGSDANGYVVGYQPLPLVGSESESVEVIVTGSGTVGSPWVVSANVVGSGGVTTVFLSDDAWVKPVAGAVARVVCVGAGGGGAGGRTTGGTTVGGGGGGGGAASVAYFPLADLPNSVAVRVGVGGPGGDLDDDGGVGGDSWFGDVLYAQGGGGGRATVGQSSGQALIGTVPEGGVGGAGSYPPDSAGSTAATDQVRFLAASGGGHGGGSSVAATSGGNIQPAQPTASSQAGLPMGEGGAGGVPDGAAATSGSIFGGGGGGGSTGTTAARRTVGAAGAQGVVLVTVW